MVFSSDSCVGSEPEVEITEASGQPTAAAPKSKTRRATRKIPLSKVGLTVAERSLMNSTPKGASKVRGASALPVTTAVGSATAGPQAEKEVVQGMCQMRGDVTPPRFGLGAKAAVPLRPSFTLRGSSG